jgi:hypothetical protein
MMTVNLFRRVSDKWQAWLGMRCRRLRSWLVDRSDAGMVEEELPKAKIEMA